MKGAVTAPFIQTNNYSIAANLVFCISILRLRERVRSRY